MKARVGLKLKDGGEPSAEMAEWLRGVEKKLAEAVEPVTHVVCPCCGFGAAVATRVKLKGGE